MLSKEKAKNRTIDAFKQFLHRFKRTPSLRELAELMGIKKSVMQRSIQLLKDEGKLDFDTDENAHMISKSLRLPNN